MKVFIGDRPQPVFMTWGVRFHLRLQVCIDDVDGRMCLLAHHTWMDVEVPKP